MSPATMSRSYAARLSPTAIDRYRTCPRSFQLTHVRSVDRVDAPSPVLAQAGAMHEALERFFGLAREDRSEEVLHQALRWAWPKHRKPDTFSSQDQEIDRGTEALHMLTGFYENFDTAAIPVAREQWVSATLPNGTEVYGKVDRIDRLRDGLEVIDYKTGRRQIDPEEVDTDSAALVYLLGTEHKYRLPVHRVRFIYLASGQEVRWEPEREDVELAKERLMAHVHAIATDEVWEPNPGPMCRWCPVALHCEARDRVALGEITPTEDVPF